MLDIQTQIEQWDLCARGGLDSLALRISEPTAIDISKEALHADRFVLSLRQYDSKAFAMMKRHYVKWSTNFGHKLRGDFHTSPPLQQA